MVTMKKLSTRQEWLDSRTTIGGSEASAIMGCNPYKSNVQLWLEKTHQAEADDISNVEFVKYGQEAEKYLRELF